MLLGGNLPNTLNCFEQTVRALSALGSIPKKSTVYISESWGYESDNMFKNQALEFTSGLTPDQLLIETQKIEKKLGRKKRVSDNYEDREIDIDILFCDTLVIEQKNLSIPHPLLHKRVFTLEPLAEIAPKFRHPIFMKSIKELLKDLGEHNKQSD